MTSRNYWIGVVSRAHVQIGLKGGFIQLNHGKKAPLQRLRAGDGLVMYSPRTEYPDGVPLQHFTAIGIIATGDIYQVEMNPEFKPFRLDVQFMKCQEAPRCHLSKVRRIGVLPFGMVKSTYRKPTF